MANVKFADLRLEKTTESLTIKHNEQEIEVKQYLPISDKLNLVSNVINYSMDSDTHYENPMRVSIYLALEIVSYYTNIEIPDVLKEDPKELYDLLVSSDLLNEIQLAIPKQEFTTLVNATWDSIESIYKYRNSSLGILETITNDYKDFNVDTDELVAKLNDPKNLDTLKEVLSKMG